MKPQDGLKKLQAYAKAIDEAKRKVVAVGLPMEKIGSKVYGDGTTVIQVGAWHEFGTKSIPQRSFLRVPFQVKQKEVLDMTQRQFNAVFEKGRTVDKALGLLGITAVNISKGAFTSKGYGEWPDIKEATKKAKGSSQPLIDTGILRGAITFVVRG